jgi:hypothetical protein
MRSTGLRPQGHGLRMSTCFPRSLLYDLGDFQPAGRQVRAADLKRKPAAPRQGGTNRASSRIRVNDDGILRDL